MVQSFKNCISVPKFPKLHFSPFLQFCPRGHASSSMSRCHNAIGPNAHMAAYKRLCTVPVRKGYTFTRHINKQIQLSLSIQLQIKITKSQKSSRTFINPSFFSEPNSSKHGEIHGSSQRFDLESSSLNCFPLQFKHEFTTWSSKLKRDRRGRFEKKRERISRFWTSKKKKKIHGFVRISSKNQQEKTESKPRVSKIQVQISEQNQVRINTYLHYVYAYQWVRINVVL